MAPNKNVINSIKPNMSYHNIYQKYLTIFLRSQVKLNYFIMFIEIANATITYFTIDNRNLLVTITYS